jgi:hypothetical protein
LQAADAGLAHGVPQNDVAPVFAHGNIRKIGAAAMKIPRIICAEIRQYAGGSISPMGEALSPQYPKSGFHCGFAVEIGTNSQQRRNMGNSILQ